MAASLLKTTVQVPSARTRAGRGWVCLLLLIICAALPAAAMATPTPGVSDQAIANVTDDATGVSDASSLTPVSVCADPGPGRASCFSQVLATRHSLRYAIHPRIRPASSPNRLGKRRARAGVSATPEAVAAAPPPQAGSPAWLQQAYDLSDLSQNYGFGKTIAVVVAYADPTQARADLNIYRKTYGLPACNSCLSVIGPFGQPRSPGPSQDTVNHWQFETSLDLEAISALCPNCHITLALATSDLSGDLSAAQINAASSTPTIPKPDIISDSFGAPLKNMNGDPYFGSKGWWTFSGIATVAASGDAGYPNDGTNEYPAALSDITAAGGTSLVPASGPRGFGESAWSGAGAGCNTDTASPKQPWQAGIPCAGRAYSDISADADPNTGISIYDSSPLGTHAAGWYAAGGTSAAAPMVAAYYALIESAQGSGVNATIQSSQWPYSNAARLNDPATGSTGSCPALSFVCNGLSGYDGPTGAGSISGATVEGAPGIGGPGPSNTYVQSVTSTTAQLQGGVYPNGDATTYWWEYGPTTVYGQATAPVPAGSGFAPAPATGTLTGLAPATTYHYRLVAENHNGTGPMYGYDFTFTTAPAPSTTNGGGGGGSTQSPGGGTTSTSGASTKPGGGSTTDHPPITRPIAPSAGKPRIAALAASTATVTATITPHNSSASYYLAYGTSSKLGHRTPARSAASALTATWHVRGLKAGKVYYLQVVAANGGGTRRSSMIRIRTSPVTISKVTRSGSRLTVTLRCVGTATCRGRLTAKAAARPIATGTFTIRGSHRATVPLRLNPAAAAKASHGKPVTASVSAVSSYNGYAATVNAKFRLIAPS
jgi:hypothetical protein